MATFTEGNGISPEEAAASLLLFDEMEERVKESVKEVATRRME